jgi:hypothetical protein
MQGQALEAIEAGYTKKVFKIFKELMPKKCQSNLGPLSADGVPIVGYLEQRERWQQHFAALLKGDIVTREAWLSERVPRRDFALDHSLVPSIEDVESVLSCQAKGRSSGEDNVVAEILRTDVAATAALVHPLLVRIFETGVQPNRWRGGVLHELWKGKGPMRSCDSHRGIFLNDVLGKAYHGLLRKKLSPLVRALSRESLMVTRTLFCAAAATLAHMAVLSRMALCRLW